MASKLPNELWRLILRPDMLDINSYYEMQKVYGPLRLVNPVFNAIATEHLFHTIIYESVASKTLENLGHIAQNQSLARHVKKYKYCLYDEAFNHSDYDDYMTLLKRGYDMESLKDDGGRSFYQKANTKEDLQHLLNHFELRTGYDVVLEHLRYMPMFPSLHTLHLTVVDQTEYEGSDERLYTEFFAGAKLTRTFFRVLGQRAMKTPDYAIKNFALQGVLGKHLLLSRQDYALALLAFQKLQTLQVKIPVRGFYHDGRHEAYKDLQLCIRILGNLMRHTDNLAELRLILDFVEDEPSFFDLSGRDWGDPAAFSQLIGVTTENIHFWPNLRNLFLDKFMMNENVLSRFMIGHKATLAYLTLTNCLLRQSNADAGGNWNAVFRMFKEAEPTDKFMIEADLMCLLEGTDWQRNYHLSNNNHQQMEDILTGRALDAELPSEADGNLVEQHVSSDDAMSDEAVDETSDESAESLADALETCPVCGRHVHDSHDV